MNEKSEWRSVKNDPPPEGERVLIPYAPPEQDRCVIIARRMSKSFWLLGHSSTSLREERMPTHWMPLPDLPTD